MIRDFARFTSDRTVEAGGKEITARRFVIATGSGPLVPPIPGIEDVEVLTNETIFALRERPDHLLIIGGGPDRVGNGASASAAGLQSDRDRR